MDSLNLVAVILGIAASLGTLATLYFQNSNNKRAPRSPNPVRDKHGPSSSPPLESSAPSRQYGRTGVAIRKGFAGFWGLLGTGAFLEGWEFGETFLMVLGIGFLFFAYRLWPKGLQLTQSERW